MKYSVLFDLSPRVNIYHASAILTGLCRLADQNQISLKFGQAGPPEASDGLTYLLTVKSNFDGARRRVAIDVRDQSDAFLNAALQWSDIYFKRSCHPPDNELLPPEIRERVRPFGLNYGCVTGRMAARVYPRLVARELRTMLGSPTRIKSTLAAIRYSTQMLASLPGAGDFEQSPDDGIESTVLFQTRVWPPEETTENLEQVNEDRVTLVHALRDAFGDRFRGGIVPTPFARANYPDVLANLPSKRRSFTAMSKRSLVTIYTRGLHHSIAFKMPEYLAASQCIVSEPIRNELPTPLRPGENYLEFTSIPECVEQCRELLGDPARARAMRMANASYYRAEVAPAAHILNCLDRSFESPVAAAGSPKS